MAENEEFFSVLQTAHDDLAARLATLDAQHSELCLERQRDATLLIEVQNERNRLQASVDKHRRTDDLAQIAISELQCSIVKAEEKLEVAEENFASRHQAHADELGRLEVEIRAKAERVAELEDLLKDGLSREQELAKLRIRIEARDKQLLRMEHVLDETREEADSLRRENDAKGIKVARLENRLTEVEEECEVVRKDWKAALRQNTAKDSIIGVLRDKLQTAGYAADEARAGTATEVARLEKQSKELQAEVGKLRAERAAVEERRSADSAKIMELEAMLLAAEGEQEEIKHTIEEVEAAAEKARRESPADFENEREAWSLEKQQVNLIILRSPSI